MFSIGSLVRPVAAAVALSLGIVPTALAEGGKGKDRGGLVEEGKKGEHQFPMKAADFMQLDEKRISRALSHLDRKLDKHNVPAVVKTQIKKDFDAGAAKIRAAATKAGADGTVTKEEAKDVRELAKDLKQAAQEKYGMGHGKGKGKAKGKGKNAQSES